MDVFDLFAKIRLDSSDYDRSLQQAGDNFEKFATKAVMIGKTVGSAITGIIGQSVKAFSSFQQLEGGVETIFGAGGKSFEDWSKNFSQSSDSMQDYIDVARKVLNGDFGVGAQRKDLLAAAGYDPETVQQMVNNLINGIDVASNVSADTIATNMQTAEEKYESLQRAQEMVMQNAREAYKTAGLSANDYMDTVTTFSASLIQGLEGDTLKAAEYADRALRDMSDNANKMGTNMGSIQAAYQGFSKQNYTMLDNLKLGYGGTKTEMERLIKDAAALTDVQKELGITVDANSMSFDNIVNAISVVQKNMGIMGTTEQEAATTIEGSSKQMSAAWKNMLTAMVTGGDWFEESIDGLVESVFTFAHNIIPAIEGAMRGLSGLVVGLSKIISENLPAFVDDMLPEFITAITTIIDSILDALPSLLSTLRDIIPILTENLSDLVPSIIDFILESIPIVIDAGITLLTGLVSGLADNVEKIVPQLTQGIIDLVDRIGSIVSSGSVGLGQAGLLFLANFAKAIVEAVPSVLTQVTQLIQDLTASIKSAADGEGDSFLTTATTIMSYLVSYLGKSIPKLIPEFTSAIAKFVTQFTSLISTNTVDFTNSAISIWSKFIEDLSTCIPDVMTDITTAVNAIIKAITDIITGLDTTTFTDTAISIISTLATSLSENIPSVISNLTSAVMDIIGKIVEIITNLDIGEFAGACATILNAIADGLVDGITIISNKLPELITGIVAWLTDPTHYFELLEAAVTIGGNLISKVPEILEALASALWGIVTGIGKYFIDNKEEILKGIVDGFSGLLDKVETIWTDKIEPAFSELGTKIWNFFLQFDWGETLLNFCKSIATGLSDIWTHAKEAFEGDDGLGAKLKNFFTSFDWGEILTNFVNTIGDGISKAWDGIKDAFTGEDGLVGKIKSWFGQINLTEAIQNLIDKIKEGIEGAWDTFKEWFSGKISSLFSGIKVPNWIRKLFGKGEGNAEDETTMDEESEKLVDMPENMVTLDYSNLEPIPDDTLKSYQDLAEAITTINDVITGGEEGEGLNSAFEGLPSIFEGVLSSAKNLASYFSKDFVQAIQTLLKEVCIASVDEEGNVSGGGGNTLYTAWGLVYQLFLDTYNTSQNLARYWTGEFLTASKEMRKEAGHAQSAVEGLSGKAEAAAKQFQNLATQIYGVIDAYLAMNRVKNNGGKGGGKANQTDLFKASGGPVYAGQSYIVGEEGPEVFSPTKSGYIKPNHELGNRETNININFNGDVIGDEQSIYSLVNRAAKAAIRQEVRAAV